MSTNSWKSRCAPRGDRALDLAEFGELLIQNVKAVLSDLVDVTRHGLSSLLVNKPGNIHDCRRQRVPAVFAGLADRL